MSGQNGKKSPEDARTGL